VRQDYLRRRKCVTSTDDIDGRVTSVARPLGGGLYRKVPYKADLGVVALHISAGVVPAPIFSMTRIRKTGNREWNKELKSTPRTWANFETKNFLQQNEIVAEQYPSQQRGYTKYTDIVQLCGWESLSRFFR